MTALSLLNIYIYIGLETPTVVITNLPHGRYLQVQKRAEFQNCST